MPVKKFRDIEVREGKPLREILTELYEKHGSNHKVAESLGISESTLTMWLLQCGLKRKVVVEPVAQAVQQ